VSVVDDRLQRLSALAKSPKTVAAQVTFVDIAGLVRGASEGEGMGNEFLSNIREVSAIVHVVRCFENTQIQHVDGSVDSARDLDTIDSELRLADLQTLDTFIEKARARLKRVQDSAEINLALSAAQRCRDLFLSDMQRAAAVRELRLTSDEWQHLRLLNLLSIKPQLVVCNVGEGELRDAEQQANVHVRAVREALAEQGGVPPVVLCASLEADLAGVGDAEEMRELMSEYGIAQTGLEAIAGQCRQLLGLHSFYTVGNAESETKMWTIPMGFTAAQAAGTIHTDFEKKFVHANCVSADHILDAGAIPPKDKWRREGRNYVCQDGDCFRFQVRK
jgi:ribosome-binding ATPase